MKTLALDAGARDAVLAAETGARIGPNAIIQLGVAVGARLGEAFRADLYRRAGLAGYLEAEPHAMVEEGEVIALHRALRSSTDADLCRELSWEAGLLTGDYILTHRIPKAAQRMLAWLPAGLAGPALTAAIAKNAWTFAGSGHFHAVSTRPLVLEISGNPFCRGERACAPLCHYYAGTFTRLYQALVDPRIRFEETACAAAGAVACRFEATPTT